MYFVFLCFYKNEINITNKKKKKIQNSQQNTCAKVCFLIKLQAFRRATLLKKRLCCRCFPVKFAKFLRTSIFTEHLWWLLVLFLTLL